MFILTQKKQCTECRERKSLNDFHKDSSKKSGYKSRCKVCECQVVRERYNSNPEKFRERSRQFRNENLEKAAERFSKWRNENLEKAHQAVNRWRSKNPEKNKEITRRWHEANPEKRQEHDRNRRARENGNGGKIAAVEWKQLKDHYRHTCLCCGKKEPEIKLELDHVIPLVLGGENKIQNAQPLCSTCNRSKGTKHIDYR